MAMKRLILLLLLLAPSCFAQRTASNPLGGNLTVQDAGTCSTGGSFLWQVLPSNASTTTVNLAGTFSGTVTVRESNNGGGSWTTAGTQTAVGTASYSTNGFTDICADVTTYTSGTISVTISTGLNTGPVGPVGPVGAGGVSGVKSVDSGTTDLGASVNTVLATFGTAPLCGIIYLPLGTFNTSTTLNISNREGCRLIGQGDGEVAGATRINWTGAANGTMLTVAGCYSCEITGFTLNGASSAGVGINYNWGGAGGLTSQQSSFHDLTILNITGTPGQGIYVGNAADHQVSESSFDRIFEIGFVTGVRQEGINTLNVTYKDFSMTATAATTVGCFDIAAGNFRGIHNTCEAPPAAAIAAYNFSNTVTTIDILDSYVEGSAAPVLNAPGVASTSSVITLIGNNFGTSASNTNFFNVTTNGSLVLFGNQFKGTAATATYSPVGLIGSGYLGSLFSKGNQWQGITLTSGGTAYTADVNDGSFTTSAYNNALAVFGASHINVVDSTNVQFYKSPITLYDGTTRYNLGVGSTGLQITNSAGSLLGGVNTGNPASNANFEMRSVNAASFNLRNGSTLKLAESSTAPTITGAGCGGSAATIASNNGTVAFTIGVGTAPLTACAITLPTASVGWACFATDQTTPGTSDIKQTANTTTSATLTNFNSTTGIAANFTANDVVIASCHGF